MSKTLSVLENRKKKCPETGMANRVCSRKVRTPRPTATHPQSRARKNHGGIVNRRSCALIFLFKR
jgi:hypothetical protein